MGYECPVCATEEADGEHLANHLGFTALVRGGDHEAWLDEHVPDWADRDPDGLASDVTDYATETETEPSSEPHDHDAPAVERTEGADLSGEAAEILAEAEELTRQMHGDETASEDSGGAERDTDADSENE
jgi:hypothetical protein